MKLIRIFLFVLIGLFLQACTTESGTDLAQEVQQASTSENSENGAYDRAFEWLEQATLDSAYRYFVLAKDRFLELEDRFGAGKCLVNLSLISIYEQDYYGAQELALEAIPYFEMDNPDHFHHIATNYNNIGSANLHLERYPVALHYFRRAIEFAEEPAEVWVYQNNKARAFYKTGAYKEAINLYEQVLSELEMQPESNRLTYARVLTNRAVARQMVDPSSPVVGDLREALQIRKQGQDPQGLSSSYYHLSQYFQHRHQLDSAYYYAQQMYQNTLHTQAGQDRLLALEQLIRSGPIGQVRRYFEEHKTLEDTLRLNRESAKNQFAMIRYEADQSKLEALQLRQDYERKNFQVLWQRFVMFGIALLALIFIVSLSYWNRRKQQRLALEADHRIQTHQLQTSQKIHDVVANGLYRVMNEMEHVEQIDREELLDKLEDMYEKSRDISHGTDVSDLGPVGFHQQLKNLIGDFYAPDLNILLIGSDEEFWSRIPVQVQNELRIILQELLVNMKKHSQATTVAFQFARQADRLHVSYTDNGVGFPNPFTLGRGLRNTENRIEGLNGELTFVPKANGATIEIALPLD